MGWQGVQVLACPWVPPKSGHRREPGARRGGVLASESDAVVLWPRARSWTFGPSC